jgi:hypothetical protein
MFEVGISSQRRGSVAAGVAECQRNRPGSRTIVRRRDLFDTVDIMECSIALTKLRERYCWRQTPLGGHGKDMLVVATTAMESLRIYQA